MHPDCLLDCHLCFSDSVLGCQLYRLRSGLESHSELFLCVARDWNCSHLELLHSLVHWNFTLQLIGVVSYIAGWFAVLCFAFAVGFRTTESPSSLVVVTCSVFVRFVHLCVFFDPLSCLCRPRVRFIVSTRFLAIERLKLKAS